MKRGYQYVLLLILSILTLSSLYLAFTSETGFGDATVDTADIDILTDENCTCKIFTPRIQTYPTDYPVILTIPDFGQTYESLYAVNIELARRNFTVISFDLSALRQPDTNLDAAIINSKARDFYSAFLTYVNHSPNIRNDRYGVIGYSYGFQIALAMSNYTNSPSSYIALGDPTSIDFPDNFTLPGNTYFALGHNYENISLITSLLENVTGLDEIPLPFMYGSFEKQDAYGLQVFSSLHELQLHDKLTTISAIEWAIRSIQGNTQFNRTLDVSQTVFQYRTYSIIIGPITFFGTLISLFIILISVIPKRFQFHFLSKNQNPPTTGHAIALSSFLGLISSSLLILTMTLSFSLVSFIAAILVGLYLSVFVLSLGNRRSTNKMIFNTVNIFVRNPRNAFEDLLKSIAITALCLVWTLAWLFMTPFIVILDVSIISPYVLYMLEPSNVVKAIIIGGPILLYILVEALIIRGFSLAEREWNSNYSEDINLIFALFARIMVIGFFAIIVYLFAINGMILSIRVALLMIRFSLLTIFSTLIISWSTIRAKNPIASIILSTVVYVLILTPVF
ncbi:MAG: membrane protein of unknown function [Candidatus Thorarchaeota archaeon]|nr:MAG: membrane protein of unknown function [Candidatus Thorarchaeota archaeon]